jgi:hypothetical protein
MRVLQNHIPISLAELKLLMYEVKLEAKLNDYFILKAFKIINS